MLIMYTNGSLFTAAASAIKLKLDSDEEEDTSVRILFLCSWVKL